MTIGLKILNILNAKTTAFAKSFLLSISASKRNFSFSNYAFISVAISPKIFQFLDDCSPLTSEKLALTCFTSYNESTPCNETLSTNFRGRFDCNYYNQYSKIKEPKYTQIFCRNGEWDRPLIDDFCEIGKYDYNYPHRVLLFIQLSFSFFVQHVENLSRM